MNKSKIRFLFINVVAILLVLGWMFYDCKGSRGEELFPCRVYKVVDGDTFHCTYEDRRVLKIRLLGISAPEITFGKNECYGQESKSYLKDLIADKIVGLQFDKVKPSTDKFGRTLAYVFIDDIPINFRMVSEGYAKSYARKYPTKRYPSFIFNELEYQAKKSNFGLWNRCVEKLNIIDGGES
jgi:micrococcal nuclease